MDEVNMKPKYCTQPSIVGAAEEGSSNLQKTLRTQEEAERDLRLAIRSSHAACDEDQVVSLVLGLTFVNVLFPLV